MGLAHRRDRLQLSAGWRAFAGSDAPLEYASLSRVAGNRFPARRSPGASSPPDSGAEGTRAIPAHHRGDAKHRRPPRLGSLPRQGRGARCGWPGVAHGGYPVPTSPNRSNAKPCCARREAQLRLLTENVPALMVRFDKARESVREPPVRSLLRLRAPASLVRALLECPGSGCGG